MRSFAEIIADCRCINFDCIIQAAAETMPPISRLTAKARVSGGIRLLKKESELNDYLVAFGEIHRAKLLEFLPHIPFGQFSSTGIIVIDWGCGQAVATAVLVDYLRSRNISVEIKSLRLIELVEPALKRAELIVGKYFCNSDIKPEAFAWSEKGLQNICMNLPPGVPVLHLFSNILDVRTLDLPSVKAAVTRMRSGRESYVLSVGPDMETKMSSPSQLLKFFRGFEESRLLHVYPNGGTGRIYGEWKYWPYEYCKCYGFAYGLAACRPLAVEPISEKESSLSHTVSDIPIDFSLSPVDPDDIFMYASAGTPEELEPFVDAGVDINRRNDKGATALYFAAKHGNLACVRFLLSHGADMELFVRTTGFTPYLIAVKYERAEIISVLKEKGCNTSVRDLRGRDAKSLVRVYNLDLKEDEL